MASMFSVAPPPPGNINIPGWNGIEGLVNVAGSLLGTCAIVMPDRRPADPLTLSHIRSAESVHWVGSWLLRGSDLEILKTRTPFLAETSEQLWEYYQSLMLDRRLDGFFGMLLGIELLSSSGILTREQAPRTRRFLDFCCAAVGVAGMFPVKLFYHLHNFCWTWEYRYALRDAHGRQPMMLHHSEVGKAVLNVVESAKVSLGVPSALENKGASALSSYSGSSGSSSKTQLLLILSLGAGAACWFLGAEGLRKLKDDLGNKISTFMGDVGATVPIVVESIQPWDAQQEQQR
eukprot:TRINITY_DN112524_c0_g1_i1.p1 TRINITY_DN112524_c0_g1~~TRINITY_DN112524_c0_g1_i1.p1  ORF type:complete len:313 (-),score=42.41 TRINITY_DN112524_c0_g1_i1:120-989(-)